MCVYFQSGSSLDDWSHHEDLEEQRDIAFQLGQQVDCSTSDTQELMSCLRQVDAEELIQASYDVRRNTVMYLHQQ